MGDSSSCLTILLRTFLDISHTLYCGIKTSSSHFPSHFKDLGQVSLFMTVKLDRHFKVFLKLLNYFGQPLSNVMGLSVFEFTKCLIKVSFGDHRKCQLGHCVEVHLCHTGLAWECDTGI